MFSTSDIANDATFVAGDFFDAEAKELYKLWKPAKLIGLKNFHNFYRIYHLLTVLMLNITYFI